MNNFSQLSDNQARMLTDTRQLAEASNDAHEAKRRFQGSMRWKISKGGTYLVRSLDGRGTQKSLGKQSVETEAIYNTFTSGKAAADERVESIRQRLEEQARFNRAARIGRVPTIAAKVLRKLDRDRILGRGIIVVGTNALYAYESEAAVMIDRGQTATGDIDLLWDVRQRLQLTGDAAAAGMIGILKSVDPTFERSSRAYRAANADGYMIDLIRPMSTPVNIDDGRHSIADNDDDLQAAEIEGLWWLKNVPMLSSICVADDGLPVLVAAPHPVAFAAHKRWLSERPNREPAKRRRDRAQSDLVAQLVAEYLPMWRYNENVLQALPRQLRAVVEETLNA
jgi:hypothetical protein